MILNDDEQKFICYLAQCFRENNDFMQRNSIIEELNLKDADYDVLMKKMVHIGAVDNVKSVMRGICLLFQRISTSGRNYKAVRTR